MQYIRKHILVRILCGLVAAIILNISVDTPDMYNDSVPEDLSYNDIESVVEWVCEDVLNIENAFPEHDENDSSSPLKIEKSIQLYLVPKVAVFVAFPITQVFAVKHNFGYVNFYSHSATDELFQPPEA